jgi:hypothetical protein
VPLPPRDYVLQGFADRDPAPPFCSNLSGEPRRGNDPPFRPFARKGAREGTPPPSSPLPPLTREQDTRAERAGQPPSPPFTPHPRLRTNGGSRSNRTGGMTHPFRPCVQRGPGEVCPRPFLVPAPVFPRGCAAPRACPRPPSSPRVQRGRAPPLCTRGEVRGLSPPPPFPRRSRDPASAGHAKGRGGSSEERRAKRERYAPLPPLCPRPPVDARPPSARPRPLPLPPFRARHSRPLPLRGMRKGRGGAGREKYAPFALALPCCRAECAPSPPGSPHVQRGSAPLCTCGEVGGLSLPPFRARPASVGHAKGEGVTQARNARRRAKGAPPPLCPRPPPLPRGPIVRALTPRFATRAERERPRFAHALKWGALPFPPPFPRASYLCGACEREGGRAKGTRPPVRASPPRFATRAKRGGFPLCTRGELGGSPHVRRSRPASARRACERGPQPPLTPVYAPRRWGSARAPFPPQLGGVRGNRSPPPLAYEGDARAGSRAIPEAAGQPHTTGQGPREREGRALLRPARLCANPRPSSRASVTVHAAGGGKRECGRLRVVRVCM